VCPTSVAAARARIVASSGTHPALRLRHAGQRHACLRRARRPAGRAQAFAGTAPAACGVPAGRGSVSRPGSKRRPAPAAGRRARPRRPRRAGFEVVSPGLPAAARSDRSRAASAAARRARPAPAGGRLLQQGVHGLRRSSSERSCCQAQAFRPTSCNATSATRPQRTGRQARAEEAAPAGRAAPACRGGAAAGRTGAGSRRVRCAAHVRRRWSLSPRWPSQRSPAAVAAGCEVQRDAGHVDARHQRLGQAASQRQAGDAVGVAEHQAGQRFVVTGSGQEVAFRRCGLARSAEPRDRPVCQPSPVRPAWRRASHGACWRPSRSGRWPRSGASAKCSNSTSSSTASSSRPPSAARSRAAGALGMARRCQATSSSGSAATTESARGRAAAGLRPCRTTPVPSALSTQLNSAGHTAPRRVHWGTPRRRGSIRITRTDMRAVGYRRNMSARTDTVQRRIADRTPYCRRAHRSCGGRL
jgi:hypothetical protein